MSEPVRLVPDSTWNTLQKLFKSITMPMGVYSENKEEYLTSVIRHCRENAKEGLKIMTELFE